MKKILALFLIFTFVLLCGCAATRDDVSEVSEPNGTEFAPTVICDDDVLTVRVVSAQKTDDVSSADNGVTYTLEFKNKTDEAITVDVSGVTVNDTAVDVSLSAPLGKGENQKGLLIVSGETMNAIGATRADRVGLHLKATSNERWWAPVLSEHDLVFYPVAQATATATATAAMAA